MGLRNQFLASGVLCLVCVSVGIIETWPSYTILLFKSENTTLSRPMTETELSLFGSLSCIGAVIATPLSGYLLDKIGRKNLTIAIAFMHVISWITRSMFKNVEIILVSCVVSGIGSCGILVVIVFISEYCQESIRGTLTSGPNAIAIIGMLISYWIGGTLDYYTVCYISLSLAILSIVMISFLKESPTHLMRNGMEKEAAKAIAFYRNEKLDSEEVLKELASIRRALNPELDEIPLQSPENEKLNPESIEPTRLSTWQFIKKSSSTRRAFAVCFTLGLISVFQGVTVIQVYAVPLFKDAVPNISSTLTTVIFAVVSFITAILSGFLTDLAGRRVLLMYGSIATGVFCLLLGSQLQLTWGPHWLTAVFIYLYSVCYVFGAGTVPFVLLSELFLPEVKGLASMLIGETFWLANFIILYIFNPLVKLIGLPPVFYIFSSICFTTAILTFFILPETKGLPVDAIQLLFTSKKSKKRPTEA